VSLTKSVKSNLVKDFGVKESKIKVIYNSYDISTIQSKSKEVLNLDVSSFIKNKSTLFLNVGRLSDQKGQLLLLSAFRKIVEYDRNSKLIILGEGELELSLKEKIMELDLIRNVLLLSFLPNPFPIYELADVFVFPSKFEGFGNAIIEAMACGLPIISANCKFGPSEIIDNQEYFEIDNIYQGKFGVLVPMKETREQFEIELFEAMRMLLINNTQEFLSKKSLERVRSFDKSNGNEWVDLIKNYLI
tara:strand:- start:324 stop:1061 length:738 start_codon:yes stop_codon:yes gene_type:complete